MTMAQGTLIPRIALDDRRSPLWRAKRRAHVSMLRSEMRERMAQAIEALVKRVAPDLVRLDADDMAARLAVELVRVVEGVQDEGLRRLAELATGGES